MATGKCPKCEKATSKVYVESIDVYSPSTRKTWNGANYLCPHCRTILSVSIDPLALNNDLVRELRKR